MEISEFVSRRKGNNKVGPSEGRNVLKGRDRKETPPATRRRAEKRTGGGVSPRTLGRKTAQPEDTQEGSTSEGGNSCSTIKKNEISPFAATRMDSEGVMLSELRQTETNAV